MGWWFKTGLWGGGFGGRGGRGRGGWNNKGGGWDREREQHVIMEVHQHSMNSKNEQTV
jgi:hypothetical protein